MEISLAGKVVLVTGGSRGIGRAIAHASSEAGAQVMLTSRKQESLEKAAAEMPGEVAVFAANAGDPDAAERCVAATIERFGRIDVLVNNAATNPYLGPGIDIGLEQWDKTFGVNVRGLHAWTQAAWRAWLRDHGGVVVNIASVGGLSTEPGLAAYNTTKAAVIHLTKAMAAELGPGVRVNAIAPGLVKTDMARALWEEHGDAFAKRLPLKRLGEPVDIANAALFLASDLSSWVTGTTLVVDGGALLN